MVLTQPVGKKRSFARALLLTIVTVGLYGIYWSYKAPKELHMQFELDREGRDDGVVWLVLGVAIPVLLLVYYWKAVDHVRYIRDRLGLTASLTPGRFVGFYAVGYLVTFAFIVYAIATTPAFDPSGGEPTPEETDAALRLLGIILIGAAAGWVVQAHAFYRFQTDINGAWDAWQGRLHELTAAAPEAGPPPASPDEAAPGPPQP